MKPRPNIAESEWKVLKLLWERSPQPAYDLYQVLKESEGWHRNTVNTMLKRREQKGAVRAERYKNLFFYTPLLSEEEFIDQESNSFLDRVFGGVIQPVLIHFAWKKKLSQKKMVIHR